MLVEPAPAADGPAWRPEPLRAESREVAPGALSRWDLKPEVPAAALSFRSKGPQVAVLAGDRVKFEPVTIAQDNGATVSLGSGVKQGDKVVLNINSQIADGEQVHINDTDGKPTQVAAAK